MRMKAKTESCCRRKERESCGQKSVLFRLSQHRTRTRAWLFDKNL